MSHYIQSSNSLPLVVIIDLDGTIIGDITPQIMSFEVAKALKTAGAKVQYDMGDLKMKLRGGLIRPHFESFVSGLTSSMNVEFFVYTASEKTWAELVVKGVEAVTNVKFNRPIFTRNYCINQDREYKKGLGFIRVHILKTLKKKYGVPFTYRDLSTNMLIIDNNNVYPNSDFKNLILCPTYSFRIPENVPVNIKQDMYVKYHTIINGVLRKYLVLSGSSDYIQFQKEFYTHYMGLLSTHQKQTNKYTTDKFWLHLKDVILAQKVNSFDERTVKSINVFLRQRLGVVSSHLSSGKHTQSRNKTIVGGLHTRYSFS